MILHIYPATVGSNSVILVDDHGYYVRSRDVIFGALDVMRQLYDDIIMHHDPIE
jgi:hypothetical protein